MEGQSDGAVACKNCGVGKFNDLEGQSDEVACKDCDIGKFNNLEGQSACKNCSVGTFNNLEILSNPLTICIVCATGKYQDKTGMTSCINCTIGRYNDKLGLIASEHDALSDCSICDYGQYQSEKGQKSCTNCPAGMYNNYNNSDYSKHDSARDCIICPKGQYESNSGSYECRNCPKGRYLSDDRYVQLHISASNCTKCPKGKFNSMNGSIDSCSCKECKTGQYAPEQGLALCSDCKAGQYQDNSGIDSCKDCESGKTSDKGALQCVLTQIFEDIPIFREIIEGSTLTYTFKLGVTPSSSSYNIEVNVSIIGIGCTFGESNLKWKLIVLSEKKAEEKAAIKIDGHGHAQGSTAKDSLLHQCVISHRLRTPIQTTANENYAAGYIQTLDIDVKSSGCGTGESFSTHHNRSHPWECLCSPRFYKPPQLECQECPAEGLVCDRIGIKIPSLAVGYWRANPASENFGLYPIYGCDSNACIGGNASQHLCRKGHSGVLCATCKPDYVLQFGVCTSCPGYMANGNINTFPWQLIVASLMTLLGVIIATYVYFTAPALTKDELRQLRRKLSELDLNRIFAQRDSVISPLEFKIIADEMYGNLTDNEISYMFKVIDENNNNFISKKELEVSQL